MLLVDEIAQSAEHISKRLQQMAGGRMILLSFVKNLPRSLLRIDLCGDFPEKLLIAPKIFIADFQQTVEGRVHHFLVEKLLAVVFGAEAEIAMSPGKQIGFQ